MRFRSSLLPLCSVVLGLALPAGAEEKNGLQVNVQKVTIDRADVRGPDVNTENLDRLMGLRVSLKNLTFKGMPEGEVTWEILKRRWDTATLEVTSGVEKLPHLRAGEGAEVTMGIVKVTGIRNGAVLRKDELDWELTFTQEGREVAKFASKSNFAMLLKRAVKVDPPAAPAPATATPVTPATPAPAKP